MKRHVQYPGLRKWSGNDLMELQGEGLSIADKFLSQYGNCVITGCEISGGDLLPGLVSIGGMVMPFTGIAGIEAFPVYLVKDERHIQREYADDVVRDIAVEYFARAVQERPDGEHIEISEGHIPRFFDRITRLERKMPSFLDHEPNASDDGYDIGVEVWTVNDIGTKTFWRCHDNTRGAAVWRPSGEGGSGGANYGGAVYLAGQTDFSKASILIKEGYLS